MGNTTRDRKSIQRPAPKTFSAPSDLPRKAGPDWSNRPADYRRRYLGEASRGWKVCVCTLDDYRSSAVRAGNHRRGSVDPVQTKLSRTPLDPMQSQRILTHPAVQPKSEGMA